VTYALVGVVLLLGLCSVLFERTLNSLVLRGPAALSVLFWWAILPFFAGYTAVVVHELGHLVAGWVVGSRLVFIRFGPIEISPPFRVSLNPKRWPIHGRILMTRPGKKAVRFRTAIRLAGGSIANLLCCWGAVPLVRSGSVFFSWLALVSIYFAISSLVPFSMSGISSDGARIVSLLKSRTALRRDLALEAVVTDWKSGVAPEDFRPELVAALTRFRDNSPMTAAAYTLAYARAYYVCSADEAAQLLETALQYSGFVSPQFREALFCDAGIFQARKRKRVDLARVWLGEVSEKPAVHDHRLRVDASILEAQGDYQAALVKVDEIEAGMRKNRMESPQLATALRLLERWRSELMEKLAKSSG
jgi:hypothetical protein